MSSVTPGYLKFFAEMNFNIFKWSETQKACKQGLAHDKTLLSVCYYYDIFRLYFGDSKVLSKCPNCSKHMLGLY